MHLDVSGNYHVVDAFYRKNNSSMVSWEHWSHYSILSHDGTAFGLRVVLYAFTIFSF